jgi:nucleotide-binding universal stress UspA family protein
MKKILVPCDFSVQARQAFHTALAIAEADPGEVHLLHVIEIPVLQDPLLLPVPAFEEGLFGELESKAREQFSRMAATAPAGVNVETKVLYGVTASMIRHYIREFDITMVVMGTRGSTGIRELFVGSNTEKVVRQSPVPVMVVRNEVEHDQIKDIVFPNSLDLEKQEDLVQHVKVIQAFYGAKLHIVWINTPSNFVSDKQTKQRMKAFVNRFMIDNYTLNIYNDIYEEMGIVNFAHEIKAGMLAMGTHGRRGLAHFFAGSVTEDVVNHIDLPIWTYTMNQHA